MKKKKEDGLIKKDYREESVKSSFAGLLEKFEGCNKGKDVDKENCSLVKERINFFQPEKDILEKDQENIQRMMAKKRLAEKWITRDGFREKNTRMDEGELDNCLGVVTKVSEKETDKFKTEENQNTRKKQFRGELHFENNEKSLNLKIRSTKTQPTDSFLQQQQHQGVLKTRYNFIPQANEQLVAHPDLPGGRQEIDQLSGLDLR